MSAVNFTIAVHSELTMVELKDPFRRRQHWNMDSQFNPYLEWLGITPSEQPADYYVLLGVKRFESDARAITDAADSRMELLRRFQNGRHWRDSQRLLNEVSAARVCLLDSNQRKRYDQQLRRELSQTQLPTLRRPDDGIPKVEEVPQNQPLYGTGAIDNPSSLLSPLPRTSFPLSLLQSNPGRIALAVIAGLLVTLGVVALVNLLAG
jgi:hypothetical protein